MNRVLLSFLVFLYFQTNVFSQKKTVTATVNYGVENKELLDIFQFQNISVVRFKFQSEDIKNKSYKISIKEFKDGKLTDTKALFDGIEDEYFKIKLSQLSFKIFSEISNGNLRIQLREENFGSSVKNFKLDSEGSNYIMRDFFNEKFALDYPLNEEFSILAIITPTVHKDGSASYCEVVQANIKPEELGNYFKIPHYFLVTMKFQ